MWVWWESYVMLVEDGVWDGGVEFIFFIYLFDWLVGWILLFGGEVEVLELVELWDKVKMWIVVLVGWYWMEEVGVLEMIV